ncbi:LysR family transcriptional regulator [Euzebya pacifica]|uniref:LysR family transcriptional regulator n=1 Tax=Euzebya pacifica TaxID=1608957 RepID=UPI0013E08027|nr:LysR family transcriptional regulator [Euzebya pacifica]
MRDLRTFLVCARLQHFTQAAEELAYAQSTVTAQVRSLEKELDVPLFDRVGRGVVLTPAGQRLEGYARRIVDLVEEASATVAFVGSQPHGDLTISATETLSTFQLPDVLREFQRRFPDVRLFLRPHDPADLVARVVEGDSAAAITLDVPISHPDLTVETLREEEVWLLAPPDHPLAGRRRLGSADLAPFRLLLSELDVSYGGAFIDRLAAEGVVPIDPMEFSSVAAIKQCVRVGMGLTALPAFASTEEVESGQLVVLPFACPSVTVQLLWHRHRWVPPAAEALLALTRELLGQPSRVDSAGP